MNYMTISFDELSALSGLSYLPQLIYIHGIKPYIDFKSGIVGIKRGISYQSIAEVLYIEPHSGIASGSPTKSQIRRALKSLERVGLINIQSLEKKLIIQCCLATLGYSVQKQVITNPTHETVTKESVYNPVAPSDLENLDLDPDIAKTAQVIIPLYNKNKQNNTTTRGLFDDDFSNLKKQIIATDFYPSSKTIEQANAMGLNKITDPAEIQKFIAYNQANGSRWANFDYVFISWLQRDLEKSAQKIQKPREKRDGRTNEKYSYVDAMAAVHAKYDEALRAHEASRTSTTARPTEIILC